MSDNTALSPRTPAPKLRSNSPYGKRRTKSVYETVALARGYTVKAGLHTRSRLTRGIPRPVEVVIEPVTIVVSPGSASVEKVSDSDNGTRD